MPRTSDPRETQADPNKARLDILLAKKENKKCADCKLNSSERWTSWTMGIFICIRCSGIHRGLGTHISRVKSVELDKWKEEELKNMEQWGNLKANTYWEAKLAPGHEPSEAKIENFIRTKYVSKRWVMDGGIPDPSTIVIKKEANTKGDDDVPLNIVKEKVQLERSSSQRLPPPPQSSRVNRVPAPVDLFGDELEPAALPRPNTTEPSFSRAPPPKVETLRQLPKQNDSLLGLDFLGSSNAAPARPNSTSSTSTNHSLPSRPDLKQSILSLYATAPRTQPQQSAQHNLFPSFNNTQSPPVQVSQSSSASGRLNDAFSGLTFSATPQQAQTQKPSPFAALTSPPFNKTNTSTSSSFGRGGNFFNQTPKSPPSAPKPPATQPIPQPTVVDDFGDFSSATSPTAHKPPQQQKPPPSIPPATSSPGMDDLFDLNAPAPPPASTKPKSPSKPPSEFTTSPFMLSTPTPSAPAASTASAPPKPSSNPPLPTASAFSNMDAWGSNEAWGSPDPAPALGPATSSSSSRPAPVAVPSSTSGGDTFGGWGAATVAKPAEPKVSADEDFGGWSSAPGGGAETGAGTGGGAGKTAGGFGGGTDDLFSNVWE